MSKATEQNKHDVNVVHVLGEILSDKTIIETVYNHDGNRVRLAVKKPDGEVSICDEYAYGDTRYRPHFPDVVRNGILLLPSEHVQETDSQKLLIDVKAFIDKYVDLDQDFLEIAARYVLMTWEYEKFQKVPYLRIIGQPGSGKSRFLSVMAAICYHSSLIGIGVTSAAIYRVLDIYPGTLILDEADFDKTDFSQTITKILNAGYDREGVVFRNYKGDGDYKPKAYKCFGPKILANRRLFNDDALESRMLSVTSKATERSDILISIPKLSTWPEALGLRNRLLGYRFSQFHQIVVGNQIGDLQEYDPRMQELVYPLLNVSSDQRLPASLRNYLEILRENQTINRGMSDDGAVALAVVELCSKKTKPPFVGEVAKLANKKRNGLYSLSDRRVGSILEGLGIPKKKLGKGVVVIPSPSQLQQLGKRFGISS